MIKIYCDFSNKLQQQGLPTLTMRSVSDDLHLMSAENTTDSTVNALKNACIFMENCHDLWLEHLFAIRNEYNFINYYTIKQIIFLRYNLSKILFSDETAEHHDTEMAF